MTITNLKPTRSEKSFYGKAKVIRTDDGVITLKSYDTEVCAIDSTGNFVRLWRDYVIDSYGNVKEGYSSTTMRHINAFRETYGLEPINKKQWENL